MSVLNFPTPGSDPRVRELCDMHTYMRPHGSPAETLFVAQYVLPLPGSWVDSNRNIHVLIGENPRILWSCHTDTVHRSSGRQRIQLDAGGMLSVAPGKRNRRSNCLGADDTVGVFLCRQMILQGIPGHYIFHYGEESGCIGSSGLADLEPELLQGIEIAIAFDRRGTGDVITHQCSRRTASEAFAQSLANELNMHPDLFYRPDDGGVYTDTNEYRNLVAECTNVSVGYYGAHLPEERVDTTHVIRLLDALCQLDQGSLVVERDPAAPEDDRPFWSRWDWDEDTGGDLSLGARDQADNPEDERMSDYLDPEYAEIVRWLTEDARDRRRAH